MAKQINTECKVIRDKRTPDFFHSLTDSDINHIALKLTDEPKGRFKDHLSPNLISEFIVFLTNINPEMVSKFQRYKNRKVRKAA
ncbi:hypothetical protein [Acinetobacter ursingii]|uniref:hypothetical protein n=1 Tax=Acinetobacter ursingii TaxID=108980 RepID=UPI00254DD68E|nr:hypothetical protein [Acinetobacter ursingii]MEC6128185.1 hypothetical protein [Acinetobacter ursingii]